MKQRYAWLLVAVLLISLTGCGTWISDDYLAVEDHVEQSLPAPPPTEEEQTPVAANRSELRGAVLSFIRDWTEQGVVLVRNYDGDIAADLAETIRYATKEDPVGAYAVDYADAELTGDAVSGSISFRIVFRRSAAEIDSIVTVAGNDAAYQKIQQALENYDTALTLRIRNYTETDFSAYIRQFCLENPDRSFVLPEFSAEVYPQEGQTRILELHLIYPASRDELRLMQDSVNTILSSASSYIRTGRNDAECAALLYRFLTTRFVYRIGTEEPSMPAYSLLCERIAHSLSFSSVCSAECAAANISCRIVSGTRGDAPHYWNQLFLDGNYYYVDLMRGLERGESELTLLTTQELLDEGYVWDTASYPATPEPEPTEESGESGTPAEPTEPTTGTEPVSGSDAEPSTEPTEPTSEEPSEDPEDSSEPTEEIP